jgi:hypothetical protein
MWLPTGDPVGSLVRLERVGPDLFREVRRDGAWGKHYAFATDADGAIARMKFNNNLLQKTAR